MDPITSAETRLLQFLSRGEQRPWTTVQVLRTSSGLEKSDYLSVRPLVDKRMVEQDPDRPLVRISRLGMQFVELATVVGPLPDGWRPRQDPPPMESA